MKRSWINISGEQRPEWERLCPPDEYRIVSPSETPSVVPRAILAKAHSVFVMSSNASGGVVIWMANINRVDNATSRIDQEPFGIAFVGSEARSGCFLHHGAWTGRTTKPPEGFWQAVSASGLATSYPISELPSKPAGRREELGVQSHRQAFELLITNLSTET